MTRCPECGWEIDPEAEMCPNCGKELVVRALHALSDRAEEPLLDLNCGSLPPSLPSQPSSDRSK